MEKIFEARSEQDAIELAVNEFGVSSEFIDVEVIKRNKSGIFGLQNKITIKASVAGLPKADIRDEEFLNEEREPILHENEDFTLNDEMKEIIKAFIENTAKVLNIQIRALHITDKPYVEIDIEDENDQNLLIGRFGKNLEALQILINAALQSKVKNILGWVVVDVEKYRKKRNAWLQDLARKKAQQVLQSGKSYLMDEFSSYDRKQIHFAIKNMHGVHTESEGDSYFKRVRILLEN